MKKAIFSYRISLECADNCSLIRDIFSVDSVEILSDWTNNIDDRITSVSIAGFLCKLTGGRKRRSEENFVLILVPPMFAFAVRNYRRQKDLIDFERI